MTLENARCALFCGAAVVALMGGGTAWAANEAAQAQPAADTTALQEVVVTAQKRSEKLVDVPMAISVVSAQTAEARGISNLQDLSQAVAGVDITYGGFAVEPSIRGVTSTNPLLENNVTVYVDGFYQPDQNTINAEFANIESIQILKGPQGTLYGRNATGGAILYTTAPPSKTFTGSLEGSYGNYNTRSLSGFISGPITDRLRFSIAGYGLQSDGYYKLLDPTSGQVISNKGAPIRSYSLRTKFQADITDNLTATLGYNYTELEDARGDEFTPESNLNVSMLPSPPAGMLYSPFTTASTIAEQLDAQHDVQLTLVWHTPIGTLSSYTGQSFRKDKDDFPYGTANIFVDYRDRNFQENVDFAITAIKNLDLTIGGNYYRDADAARNSSVYVPSLGVILPALFPNGFVQDTHDEFFVAAYAFFVQGAYHLFDDRLTLSAGVRYSEEEKSESYSITGLNGVLLSPMLAAADNHANFPNFSPQGSIRYKFSEGSEVYASITDGFRSGQVQIFQGANAGQYIFAPVKPEKITAYEVGYKLDRPTVQFTSAFFYYDYTNLQQSVTLPNPGDPTSPISFVSNAPKATIYGLEGEVKWKPARHLDVDISADWLHARYGAFTGASGVGLCSATAFAANLCPAGVGANQNISPQTQNWTGQPLSRAPDWAATIAGSYEFVDVFGEYLLASANVKATAKYMIDNASLYGPEGPAGLQNAQRYVQPAYALASVSFTWLDPTKHYHIGVYVDNLSDTHYRLDFDGAPFGNYNTWAWPRTYGVRLGAKF